MSIWADPTPDTSNYFVIFQLADQSDGDRACLAGEKHHLHEEREERLKQHQLLSEREGDQLVVIAVSICFDLLLQLES